MPWLQTISIFGLTGLGNFPPLTDAEHKKLGRDIQAWIGSAEPTNKVARRGLISRDRLVRHNLRLVPHIWKKGFQARLPSNHRGLLDAFQNASVNLMSAANKYDPDRPTKFSSYATSWIQKGFNDYLMNQDRMIRIPQANHYIIKAAQAIISRELMENDKVPSTEMICEELRRSRKHVPDPETLKIWLEVAAVTDTLSIHSALTDDESLTLEDTMHYHDYRSDPVLDDVDLVMSQLPHLNHNEREVITRRYLGKAERLDKVGRDLKISRTRIHQIEQSAIEKLTALVQVNCLAA